MEAIKDKLSSVILSNDTTDLSAHQSTQPVHDFAVYSICPSIHPIMEIFRNNNNSFNLYFDPPTEYMNDPRMYMSSAILRLFKTERNGNETENSSEYAECGWNATHGDELIRVTVSAYTKKNRKYRKRTYNSIMVKKAYSGWVDLNVRSIIQQWKQNLSKNFGLAIDVHDQDENQLSAARFFHPPPGCEASDKPYPFSQFQSAYVDSCDKAVPKYPRIDYQYRFCDKTRLKESTYNKRCYHLAALEKSRAHHRHHQQNHHSQQHRARSLYKPIGVLEEEVHRRRPTVV